MFRLYFDNPKKFALTSLTALAAVLGYRIVFAVIAPFLYSGAIGLGALFGITLAYSVSFVFLASYVLPIIANKFNITA